MALNTQRKNRTVLSEINITPMVDVMLVLLIIFMVTAPLLNKTQNSIKVDLPQVSGQEKSSSQEHDTKITITTEGKIFINGDKKIAYNAVNIEDKIKEFVAANEKNKKLIYIEADEKVSHGQVAKLIGICKRLGIEQVGILTIEGKK